MYSTAPKPQSMYGFRIGDVVEYSFSQSMPWTLGKIVGFIGGGYLEVQPAHSDGILPVGVHQLRKAI